MVLPAQLCDYDLGIRQSAGWRLRSDTFRALESVAFIYQGRWILRIELFRRWGGGCGFSSEGS